MSDQVIEHIMEIKERLSVIETKIDDHVEKSTSRDEKLERVEKKILKAETSLKTLRWIGGMLLLSIPATAAAIAKILRA